MDSDLGFYEAKALLEWQLELGATEAIGDEPVNRYETPAVAPPSKPEPVVASQPAEIDAHAVALASAASASTLEELATAMAAFDHCELKKGARNFVFSDGMPGAPVMIIGEAPGRDEDREGRPFVGRAGQLLDRMLDAIEMGRDRSVYITNVLPWRPPQNRDPHPDEIAMMAPFLERHIALADPQALVLMGNTSCQAVLGMRGISKLRGRWTEAHGRATLPMFHPSYLLRTPSAKREAWADLLSLQARLREKI